MIAVFEACGSTFTPFRLGPGSEASRSESMHVALRMRDNAVFAREEWHVCTYLRHSPSA